MGGCVQARLRFRGVKVLLCRLGAADWLSGSLFFARFARSWFWSEGSLGSVSGFSSLGAMGALDSSVAGSEILISALWFKMLKNCSRQD